MSRMGWKTRKKKKEQKVEKKGESKEEAEGYYLDYKVKIEMEMSEFLNKGGRN